MDIDVRYILLVMWLVCTWYFPQIYLPLECPNPQMSEFRLSHSLLLKITLPILLIIQLCPSLKYRLSSKITCMNEVCYLLRIKISIHQIEIIPFCYFSVKLTKLYSLSHLSVDFNDLEHRKSHQKKIFCINLHKMICHMERQYLSGRKWVASKRMNTANWWLSLHGDNADITVDWKHH